MSWLFLNAKIRFAELHQEWDSLNRARGNHVLLDSRFVAGLIEHFGDDDTVLAIDRNGTKDGMALLVKTAMGIWTTFQPSQSPLGMILLGYQDESYDGLFGLM